MVTVSLYYDEKARQNKLLIKGVPFAEKDEFKTHMNRSVKWSDTYKGWTCDQHLWHLNDVLEMYPNARCDQYVDQWIDAFEKRIAQMFHVKQLPDIPEWQEKWHWAKPYQRVDAYFHKMVGRSFDWSEAGTGKTLKGIIAPIESSALENKGHAMIISPNGAKYDWRDTIKDAQTNIGVDHDIWVVEGSDRQRGSAVACWVEYGGWLIVNWEILREIGEWIIAGIMVKDRITYLVADEAHRGKNEDALQTKALDNLVKYADRYLELTATPIVVNEGDLFPGLRRAYPKMFTSYWAFLQRYGNVTFTEQWTKDKEGNPVCRMIPEVHPGFNEKRLPEWDKIKTMFSVKRTMGEVAPFFPPFTDHVMPVEIPKSQRDIYDKLSVTWLKQVGDELVPVPNVISLITHLRQILLDPALIGATMKGTPGKTAAVLDMLKNNPRPFVIMSKFVQYIDRLDLALTDAKISFVRITGKENIKQRQENKAIFQDGGVQVALCGIDAASEAITLTKAADMIFTDRDWTKKANDQARGRIRRIGQTLPQVYHILTAEGTVESRIEASIKAKGALEEAFINNPLKKGALRDMLLGG